MSVKDRIQEIYRNHHLDVYRFLICFTGSQTDAEDLTQEVFIRVLKNLESYHRGSLKTWIFSIAKHVAIDHYRKKKFSSLFSEGFFQRMVSTGMGPSELAIQNDTKRQVHDAIASLKPQQRSVVILRGINGFSVKETAEILHCSESKVKVDYHRALKELRQKLHISWEEVIGHAK